MANEDSASVASVGPSSHAGVPRPSLPPLPPPVSPTGPDGAPAAAPSTPPAPLAPAAAAPAPAPVRGAAPEPMATATAPPPRAQMGPESFNDMRKGLADSGGFNPRLLLIPLVIVLAGVGFWTTRGTTSAEDLKAGDCFVMPTADEEFERLNTESCDSPHDGQIIAEVELDGPNEYPPETSDYWQSVFNACAQQADSLLTRLDELPADTELNFFSPVEQGWERMGDRKSLCYVYSPGGLQGSFLG